jgi:predicted DNA-binding transcriptional regulator AlpA
MSLDAEFENLIRRIVREETDRGSDADDMQLLTAEAVAEILSLPDVHRVYDMKRDGELEGIMLSERTLRFRRSEVRKYIESKKEQSNVIRKRFDVPKSRAI